MWTLLVHPHFKGDDGPGYVLNVIQRAKYLDQNSIKRKKKSLSERQHVNVLKRNSFIMSTMYEKVR